MPIYAAKINVETSNSYIDLSYLKLVIILVAVFVLFGVWYNIYNHFSVLFNHKQQITLLILPSCFSCSELEIDSTKNLGETEDSSRLIAPQEACNRIAEVVQEAVRKMEMVAEEKLRMFKRARLSLEACDHELEDKAREVAELKRERQMKKQQVEELESIVRLKQAEAEMFQLKATEARQEAERLQTIALAKSEKAAAEQDYASLYLKRRLDEAEAEKQYLFEKIKLRESQRAP